MGDMQLPSFLQPSPTPAAPAAPLTLGTVAAPEQSAPPMSQDAFVRSNAPAAPTNYYPINLGANPGLAQAVPSGALAPQAPVTNYPATPPVNGTSFDAAMAALNQLATPGGYQPTPVQTNQGYQPTPAPTSMAPQAPAADPYWTTTTVAPLPANAPGVASTTPGSNAPAGPQSPLAAKLQAKLPPGFTAQGDDSALFVMKDGKIFYEARSSSGAWSLGGSQNDPDAPKILKALADVGIEQNKAVPGASAAANVDYGKLAQQLQGKFGPGFEVRGEESSLFVLRNGTIFYEASKKSGKWVLGGSDGDADAPRVRQILASAGVQP